MQAVLLMGVQASGKSTFWRERFADTHVRISLDMLRTRHREARLVDLCTETQQPFVVDNTNPTVADRVRYLAPAQAAGMKVIGYYFASAIGECLDRNRMRAEAHRVPELAIRGTHAKFQLPSRAEGFDELYYVTFESDGNWSVEAWKDEV